MSRLLTIFTILAFVMMVGACASIGPSQSVPADVDSASELLDAYDGQPGLLERSRVPIDGALAADASDVPALVALGKWHIQSGRTAGLLVDPQQVASAIVVLKRATELDPENAEAHLWLGQAYVYSTFRPGEARKELEISARLDTENPRVDLAFALANSYENAWGKVAAYTASAEAKATRTGPISTSLQRELLEWSISLDLREKDPRPAIEKFERLLTLSPDSPWYRGHYARFLLRIGGDTGKVIRLAREAIAISSYPEAQATLGVALYAQWAQFKDEDSARADALLAEARSVMPDEEAVMGIALASARFNPDLKTLTQVLGKNGASIDAPDEYGETELFKAIRWQKMDRVRRLLDSGASPDQVDSMGQPALLVGASYANGLLEALLSHGANVEASNTEGDRAIHMAALGNHLSEARTLISHHADVNAQGYKGRTPLIVAVTQKNALDMVKLLIDAGADPTIIDDEGRSPERLAALAGNQEVADWLHANAPAKSLSD